MTGRMPLALPMNRAISIAADAGDERGAGGRGEAQSAAAGEPDGCVRRGAGGGGRASDGLAKEGV